MTTSPSVVVVGAGALGVCTAFELTRLGVSDVTVIERSHVASASSGRSVGIIETQYLDPLAIAIRVYGMDVFAWLGSAAGLRITRNGYLRLARAGDDVAAFQQSVAIQRDLGVKDACVLDQAEIRRLVPDMACDDIVGGLFGPSDGYIDGHLYCHLVADLLRDRGAKVLVDTELVGADATADGRHRLATSRGVIECDVVVNAAGAWAGRVGALLGTQAAVLPQRHQALVAHLPRALDYVMPSVMDYIPSSGAEGVYFRHETDRTLIAGLHTEELLHDIVDPDDHGGTDALGYMADVAEHLARRLPGLADSRLGNVWAGLYPVSPDGRPSVGPYRDRPTVIAALGAGGAGVQSSPGIGRIAAEWIVHGQCRTIANADALLPDRDSLAERV